THRFAKSMIRSRRKRYASPNLFLGELVAASTRRTTIGSIGNRSYKPHVGSCSKLTDHKTRSVFKQYNVRSDRRSQRSRPSTERPYELNDGIGTREKPPCRLVFVL